MDIRTVRNLQSPTIAINADKWQNSEEENNDERDRDNKGSTRLRKVEEGPNKCSISQEGISGKGPGLGGEVHGIREGSREYRSSEGTPQEGKGSTRPLDSTRYFWTAKK
jgi:hypothetical protein